MTRLRRLAAMLAGDRSADSTVPPSGATGHLTTLAAAAMAILAVFAIAGALAADRVAGRWADALQGAATLELPATGDGAEDAADRALMILGQTPGIASARRLSEAEMAELLAPWIDDPKLLDALDLPVLIAVHEDETLDRDALAARLEGELPRAAYHRHDAWQGTVATAASRLGWLALGALALALAATGIVVTLAARASLAINARVIETLRRLGAQDSYIARAFVRRFTLRSLNGALAGTALGALLLALLPAGAGAALTGLAPQGVLGWAALALVPLAAAATAFLATRAAALRVLRRIR